MMRNTPAAVYSGCFFVRSSMNIYASTVMAKPLIHIVFPVEKMSRAMLTKIVFKRNRMMNLFDPSIFST
jgi:hypothetical protein